MAIDITMPALSPTMEEGTLAKWNVKVGDRVKSGMVIAEIETDKATMEVEAVDEGEVLELLVAAGSQGVKVNTVIARLAGEGGMPTPAPQPAAAPAPAPVAAAPAQVVATGDLSPAVRRIVSETGVAPHGITGTGKNGRITKADVLAAVEATGTGTLATPKAEPLRVALPGERLKASPLARRIAREKGLDLARITGSGPEGRIILRDVEGLTAAAQKAAAPAPKPGAASAGEAVVLPPSVLDPRVYAPDSYTLKPLDGMRRTVAKRLSQSFMTIPHFPLTVDLMLDKLLAARGAINTSAPEGVKISVNDMLIKAAARALIDEPEANASFTDGGIAYHKAAHVSVAVAIDGGLITPVIFRAHEKGLADIALEMKDLATRARARKLKPQEYSGGTFSISNLGMFGVKAFASIINPPEGMILSVGAGEKRPVVVGDKLEVATVMTVTLTCDHRVVDGAIGARWLQAFKRYVETPEAMLL
jgi:pyruvate dehydrogenase E2 component (dihydrolipoamide acetyltransferase)